MKRNAFLLSLLLVAPIAAFAQNTVTTTIQDTGDAIFYSFTEALRVFMAFIPRFLGALVILVIGWIVSSGLTKMVAKGLKMLGVDRAVQAAGMAGVYERAKTRWTVSDILAFLIKWFIRLIFILAAANILGMPQVMQVINSIVLFIPKMIVAIAILLVGSIAARFLSSVVE